MNMTEFAKRRKKLMSLMNDKSIIILSSNRMVKRNGDAHYPYRQQSDFYY